MMTHRFLFSTLGTLIAGLLCSVAPPAQAQSIEDFAGSYVYAGGQKQRAALAAAIESVVGEMNVLYRVIARRRLTRASKIAPRMVFAILPDGRLSIIVGNKSPLVTKLDGTPIRFKNEAGQSIKLRRHFKNSVLSTVGDRGDAKQRLVYRLSGDLKRMTVRININSDPLPRPLRYSLTYRRQ